MRKFETKVQYLKYKVLREVARLAFKGELLENVSDIPKKIVPGREATMRCCIYKERAILSERVKLAMGGDSKNPNVIEIIDIACDECPVGGYEVTEACRGCIAHRCEEICRFKAITFDHNQKAYVDKSKCMECGLCAKVCPFNAIHNNKRPCEHACIIDAISMSETKAASIDNDKCIACGECVRKCPFGAVMDKSYILNVINLILESENNDKVKLYAVVAPAISSQFTYVNLEQVVSGIKKLGFHYVIEAALGADMTAYEEASELAEKGFLTSSCCPAFVDYTNKQFPDLSKHISHNLSPMAAISKRIKQAEPDAKVVFIGPCTAKKMEFKQAEVSRYVDCVITFEELQALLDGRDIDLAAQEGEALNDASYFGRIFAYSGGLSEAVKQGLKERGFEDFDFKPVSCNGIEECRKALLKASKGVPIGNFIEGMACTGGCIGGAGCLTFSPANKSEVEKHAKTASKKVLV